MSLFHRMSRLAGRRLVVAGLAAATALCAQAQVKTVPRVVVDAQLPFHLAAMGAPVHLASPAGIAVSPKGTVFVADKQNGRILKIVTDEIVDEKLSGKRAKLAGDVSFLSPPEGLSEPSAVAAGADGTLYLSDSVKGTLYRVTQPESESPVFTQLHYAPEQKPTALTVDSQGDLWVADAHLQVVVEFSPSALVASRLASVKPIVPTGIAVTATSVFLADAATDAVYGQGSRTPLIDHLAGKTFDFAADLAAGRPTSLSLDEAGNLYLLDTVNDRVIELSPARPSIAFAVPFFDIEGAAGLAVGPTGKLYLTDSTQQEVHELVYNGNTVNLGAIAAKSDSRAVTLNYSFNAAASASRSYQSLQGDKTTMFAFGENGCLQGRVKAGDTCRQQVRVNGQTSTVGAHKGMVALSNEQNHVLGPMGIVANVTAASLAFYPAAITYLSQTSPYPALQEPQAVVISGTGADMFVADEGGQYVNGSYSYTGTVWDYPVAGGVPSGAPTQVGGSSLQAPIALALKSNGDLYIADYNQAAVFIASAANRSVLSQLPIPNVTLNHPIALAFDSTEANLYIGDAGPAGALANAQTPGSLIKVPLAGGNATSTTYLVNNNPATPVIYPQGLTVDSYGNLYIADGGDGQSNVGDLALVSSQTGTVTFIPTTGFTLDEPAGLAFDAANNLYVLDGYNADLLEMPVTFNSGAPSFGTPQLLQSIPIATGAALALWPGGQMITITDIGETPEAPVSQVVTLGATTANIAFGPIPIGSSQTQTVTAVNVGNQTANITGYTEGGDQTEIFLQSFCNGGVAPQQDCTLSFSYQPLRVGTYAATFRFSVNGTAAANVVAATATSVKATPTVTVTANPQSYTYNVGTTLTIAVSGNFTTPTGRVQVLDGSTSLGTYPLNSSGYAFPVINNLAVGTHSITVNYLGDNGYTTATSQPVIVTVIAAPTSITATCTVVAPTLSCTATVTSTTFAVPTGRVVFTIGGVRHPVTLVAGTATSLLNTLASGTYTVVVSYAAQGNFAAATSVTLPPVAIP